MLRTLIVEMREHARVWFAPNSDVHSFLHEQTEEVT